MKVKELAEIFNVGIVELLDLLENVGVNIAEKEETMVDKNTEKKLAKRYNVEYPFKSKKADKKVQKEIFDKLPTLRSQLELQDGRLSIKAESGLTEQDLSKFKSRVKQINQSIQGIYNLIDRTALEDDAITAPLMQFRKWMKPNWNRMFGRRFGKIFYNEQLGSYEVPVYLPVFDMWDKQVEAYKSALSQVPQRTPLFYTNKFIMP